MIECKYRHESTQWLFLPETYGGLDEIEFTSFLHPSDHFNSKSKFPFYSSFPLEFAPLCSKGIEITTEGQNPKTIAQAISQLSYAMAEKTFDHMYHQVDEILSKHFGNTIYYTIPIILTTANLYRLKEKTTIDQIKKCKKIEEIATKENSLIIKSKPGVELEAYNYQTLRQSVERYGRKNFEEKLNSFNPDLDFVLSIIARHYSPSCIAVIQHTENNIGLESLFNFINRIVKPDEEIFKLIEKKQKQFQDFKEVLERRKTAANSKVKRNKKK